MKIMIKLLIEYCMCVYVFGNSFLLIIVIYGFCKIVKIRKEFYGDDVIYFVCNDFYVDDGFILFLILDMVIDLMKRI